MLIILLQTTMLCFAPQLRNDSFMNQEYILSISIDTLIVFLFFNVFVNTPVYEYGIRMDTVLDNDILSSSFAKYRPKGSCISLRLRD
jgi:hypothetical protein